MPNEEKQVWGERALLERKLAASGLSARKAAEKIGMSDSRLRHIIKGYQPVGRGQRVEVVAPADTLANIALALDVTPEELEQAGRHDAAKSLRARLDLDSTGVERDPAGWAKILAEHDEILEWAQEPAIYMPPDAVLQFFDDEQLLAEVGRRMRYGSDHVTEATPLVVVPDQDDEPVAAHDDAAEIEDEQGHDEHP